MTLPNKPDINGILANLGILNDVNGYHVVDPISVEYVKQTLYTRLASEAIEVFEVSSRSDIIEPHLKAVPLSVIKEVFGVPE